MTWSQVGDFFRGVWGLAGQVAMANPEFRVPDEVVGAIGTFFEGTGKVLWGS